MFSTFTGPLRRNLLISLAFFFIGALRADGQLSPGALDEIKQQAASLAARPARLSLSPLSKQVNLGKTFQVNVTLLSADNKPVAAERDRSIDIDVELPSGKKTTQTLEIPKGATSAVVNLASPEAGLASITARPNSSDIRPAKTDLLVLPTTSGLPSNKRSLAATGKKPTSKLALPDALPRYLPARLGHSATFQTVRFEMRENSRAGPSDSGPPQSVTSSAQLQIRIDNAGSDYIANGSDAAIISAYFENPDGTPAPTNINIWLTFTRGSLAPGVLQIPKGSYFGSARLTSTWPGDVHIAFVSSNPAYALEGATAFDVQFVPLGVILNGPAKLSVIDNVPVLVVFVNDHGPIAPGKDWPVKLLTSQSKLAFTPDSLIVKGDSPLGTAMVLPKSVGSDTIEAVVSDYQPVPLNVEVTWRLILALCLAGGMLGGIAAWQQLKGSWFWRIFLGLLGGAFLSWLYVFLALPITVAGSAIGNVAHNTISLFFVSVLGGYAGLRVIDFAARKAGLLT